MKNKLLLFFVLVLVFSVHSQNEKRSLKPAFNALEADETLVLFDAFMNRIPVKKYADSVGLSDYKLLYRSKSMGLDNLYDVWLHKDSIVVLSLRGTTHDSKSLLADFYCAMVPGKGTIQLNDSTKFDYKIAADDRATVHAGFLAGFAFIANDFQPLLDSLYKSGFRQFMIGGQSQGGALVYYASAWLYYLSADGVYPDLILKSYAAASPKMANSYFVYDYDHWSRSEWSFSITNSFDPIPEMPLTTQQLIQDINASNPLVAAKSGLKSAPLLKRMVLKSAYNKMERKATKSSKSYQKYLGKYVGKFIGNKLPQLKMPEHVNTTYFMRPGVPVSLVPNDAYFNYFNAKKIEAYNHSIEAYRYLLRLQYSELPELNK